MYQTIIIGGGPAGMMAAIKAAENNDAVLLIEKNEKLGKKLYITGKGRCNITNASDVEFHLKQQTCNSKFLYSAFYTFDSTMLMAFLEEEGLKLKIERGQRVFPASDKSSDVIKTLEKTLEKKSVDIMLNTCVKELLISNKQVQGIKTTKNETIIGKNVVIATGGVSYSMTGATGDGYQFGKACGHKIVSPLQGLVPVETIENDIYALQGLALKNVNISVKHKDQEYYSDMVKCYLHILVLVAPLFCLQVVLFLAI